MSKTNSNVNIAELLAQVGALDRKSKTLLAQSLAGQLGAILMFPKGIQQLGTHQEAPPRESKDRSPKNSLKSNPKEKKPTSTGPVAHPEVKKAVKQLESAKKALIEEKKRLQITAAKSEDPRLGPFLTQVAKDLELVRKAKTDHPTQIPERKAKPNAKGAVGASAVSI
jgi:hypothetical protein